VPSEHLSLGGSRSNQNIADSGKPRITSKDPTLKTKANLPTAVNSLEPTRVARKARGRGPS